MCDHKQLKKHAEFLSKPNSDIKLFKIIDKIVREDCEECIEKFINKYYHEELINNLRIMYGKQIDDFDVSWHHECDILSYHFTRRIDSSIAPEDIISRIKDVQITGQMFDLVVYFIGEMSIDNDGDYYPEDEWPVNKKLLKILENFLIESGDQTIRWRDIYRLYEDKDIPKFLDNFFENVWDFDVTRNILDSIGDNMGIDSKYVEKIFVNYIDGKYEVNIRCFWGFLCRNDIDIPYEFCPELCKKQDFLETLNKKKYNFYNDIVDVVSEHGNDDVKCIEGLIKSGYYYDMNTFILATKAGNKKCAEYLQSFMKH